MGRCGGHFSPRCAGLQQGLDHDLRDARRRALFYCREFEIVRQGDELPFYFLLDAGLRLLKFIDRDWIVAAQTALLISRLYPIGLLGVQSFPVRRRSRPSRSFKRFAQREIELRQIRVCTNKPVVWTCASPTRARSARSLPCRVVQRSYSSVDFVL